MTSSLATILLTSALALATPVFAQSAASTAAPGAAEKSAPVGKLVPITEQDAAWAAKARENYPSKLCVVSEEPLGSMGKPADFIYRVEGQPDRLVRFCCGGCRRDFLSDPEAHLKKLEAGKADAAKQPGHDHSHS